MESLEPKKLALIRILEILHKRTDSKHTLKQEQIRDILSRDYGIELERKSIGKNLSLLKELGYEIEWDNGVYLASRIFEESELRLLIDGVLSSKYISPSHSKDLIDKLCSLGSEHFKEHVKNIYSVNDWNKTDNVAVFYNIDIIDEALDKKRQITFDYNKYNADGKLVKSAWHKESPIQMMLKNQNYYLMAYNEKWHNVHYIRLDKITNIKITDDVATSITDVEGYKTGINYKEISSSLPYMFSDKPERVEFLANKCIIDQVIDWFGKVDYKDKGDNYLITTKVSPHAMKYWALQYLDFVEVLYPDSLREEIKQTIQYGYDKYK